MRKKNKIVLGILLPILAFCFSMNFAFADIAPPGDSDLPDISPSDLIVNVLNWLAGILALISVLVIVIAGIMWATAGGNDETVKKARTMILYAIIGLVIAGAAYGFVNVVIDYFFA